MAIDNRIERARARGLYTDYELDVLWPKFLAEREKLLINKNKQNRHIIESKEFIYFDGRSKSEGKAGYSFFFPDFDIVDVLPELTGTGILEFENGLPQKETLFFPYKIGYGGRQTLVETNVLSIRYSSTGIHAFPVHPNIYKDTINRLKKKNRWARFTASCRSVLIGFPNNIQSFLRKVKIFLKKLKKGKNSL